MQIELPVRFTGREDSQPELTTLKLPTDKTAFLLGDCDGDCGDACNALIRTTIAPALQSARSLGIRSIFVCDKERIVGPASRPAEYHELQRGKIVRPATI